MASPVASLHDINLTREAIYELAAKYRVENVRVFGSFARDEAGPESDVDFLVDPLPSCTGLDLGGLHCELEALLRRSVDLVTTRSLHRLLRDQVLREARSV